MDKIEIQEKLIDILAKHTAIERSAVTPEKIQKISVTVDFIYQQLHAAPRANLSYQ
jgi:hypothetical protein